MKEKLDELQRQYEEKLATKEDLRKKAELTELRLDRAAKIVTGLADERTRWEESVKVCAQGGGASWRARGGGSKWYSSYLKLRIISPPHLQLNSLV